MKIVHCADIHLGRRRLDGRLPETDFAEAFAHIAEAAIRERADVFLLAGDLFDRPQVEPPHLRQAQDVLGRLRAAGIPVIAIEGNHDRAFLNSSEPTWLNYLADDGLLILLAMRFNADGPVLAPWEGSTRAGSWLDLGGVRFVGAGYLGAATPHKLRQIVERLDADKTHVLLLHAGPDYFVGEAGGFAAADLKLIREKVSYLALGHIHKPMLHGGWACNPGSPENCDLQEAHYDLDRAGQPVPRGYALAELRPQAAPGSRLESLIIRSTPRRPCFHLALDCTPFGNKLKHGAVAIEQAACALIRERAFPPHAVVQICLSGRINLNRVALELPGLQRNIEQSTGLAAVAVDASGINLGRLAGGPEPEVEPASREELERGSIHALVQEECLWGLAEEQESIANLFYELKEAVRLDKSADELAEHIRSHRLVEKVRLATMESGTAEAADPAAAAAAAPEARPAC